MNTPNSEIAEIQLPKAGRRNARYSDDFKRQVVAACLESVVSKAAIALANGLNANMLRRWVVQASQRGTCQLAQRTTPAASYGNTPDPRRPPKVLHLWPPKLLHPAMGDLMH